MGGGASITYSYEKITVTTESGEKADLDPREYPAPFWSWAAWMRPDGAPDANGTASMCASNSGPSNCGEVGAYSALQLLGCSTCNDMGNGAVTVNSRYHGDDLAQYLAARSVAGCTADDIVKGVHTLSENAIQAKFFGLGPASPAAQKAPPEELACSLALWIAADAAPIATLNLQAIMNADAWHHQLVWGAGMPEPSCVLLSNGVGGISAARLKKAVCSERVLKIMRSDIEGRMESMETEEAKKLFADNRWKSLNVANQIRSLKTNQDKDVEVSIPASYVSGITLCAQKGSACAKAIDDAAKKHKVGDPLPHPQAEVIENAPLALSPQYLGMGCDVNALGVFKLISTDAELRAELMDPTESKRIPALIEVLATEVLSKPLQKEKPGDPQWQIDTDKLLGNPPKLPIPAETVASRARKVLGKDSEEAEGSWRKRLEASRAFCEIDAFLRGEGAGPLKRYVDALVPKKANDPYGTAMARKKMAHTLLSVFYAQATPQPALKLSNLLDAVGSSMVAAFQKAKGPKPEVVFVVNNKVSYEHHFVRKHAYPYDVRHLGGADGDQAAELVVEARRKTNAGSDGSTFMGATRVLETFKEWDVDGDGVISHEELAQVLKKAAGLKDDEIKVLFEECDANRDGKIQYEEFVNWICRSQNTGVQKIAPDSEAGGELLGFISMRSNEYIIDVAVAPKAQGMGLGARLIKAAAKECRKRATEDRAEQDKAAKEAGEEPENWEEKPLMIKLHVRIYNLPARALYLKLGFKETERCFPAWYDWHGGVSMEVLMEKVLNPPEPPLMNKPPEIGFLMTKGPASSGPTGRSQSPAPAKPKSGGPAGRPQSPAPAQPKSKAQPKSPAPAQPKSKAKAKAKA